MTGVQTCALPIFGIAVESIQRLIEPRGVAFAEATAVAVMGLMVNLVSAWLLSDGHHHGHGDDGHHHHDHNLRSAYFHVLADALTSVLAIAALLPGRPLGRVWMDGAVGITGEVALLRCDGGRGGGQGT